MREISNRRIAEKFEPRRGTTLLEVLLGLVILATLLSSVAIARGRFLRQWADADRRLKLIDAADRLMNDLSHSQPDQLASAGGSLAEPAGGRWHTALIHDVNASQLDVVHVRLIVEDEQNPSPQVRVDFVVHNPHATTSPAGRS